MVNNGYCQQYNFYWIFVKFESELIVKFGVLRNYRRGFRSECLFKINLILPVEVRILRNSLFLICVNIFFFFIYWHWVNYFHIPTSSSSRFLPKKSQDPQNTSFKKKVSNLRSAKYGITFCNQKWWHKKLAFNYPSKDPHNNLGKIQLFDSGKDIVWQKNDRHFYFHIASSFGVFFKFLR
jgi:hypothetical protein